MTQVLEIIKDAYRESNLIGIIATPNANQIAEGLARLRPIISSTLGYYIGEDFTDLAVGYSGHRVPNYNINQAVWSRPQVNTRLILNQTAPELIYLPDNPRNGSRIAVVDVYEMLATYNVTLNANGFTIEDNLTLVLSVDGYSAVWMFYADEGNWRLTKEIASENDQMPLDNAFDDYFIVKLAARLNPRYGRSLSDLSIARLQEQQTQLEAKYRQTRSKPVADNLTGGLIRQSPSNRYGWMR